MDIKHYIETALRTCLYAEINSIEDSLGPESSIRTYKAELYVIPIFGLTLMAAGSPSVSFLKLTSSISIGYSNSYVYFGIELGLPNVMASTLENTNHVRQRSPQDSYLKGHIRGCLPVLLVVPSTQSLGST